MDKMEMILMSFVYIFEFVVGIGAVGFMTLILAGIFDKSSNEQAKRFANYILGVHDEDYL